MATTKPCIPEIYVDSTKMSAHLLLHLDDNGQEFELEEIKQLLSFRRVATGIIDSEIERMIEEEIYDVQVEVAKGKAPIKGDDGYFIFHVKNAEQEDGPIENEDGTVEYIGTKKYTIVEEGQLVAEYVPAKLGQNGYDLSNTMRMAQKGKELPPLKGTGFWNQDGKYYSSCHGKIELTDKGIYITNVLEVKDDVDVAYGHIDYDGDVLIRGSVRSGLMVKATGNIEIKQHVGNAYVEAGGDITIHEGMQGKFLGTLKAKGNIRVKFLENCNINCQGDLEVRTALHSKIESNGKVIVQGRDAVVLGGTVHALAGMDLAEAGNYLEVATVLSVGPSEKIVRRDVELNGLIKKVEGEVELLDKSAKVLDRMDKTKVTKETEGRRMKIMQAKIIKSTELKQYRDEKMQCARHIEIGSKARVSVSGKIYPGCRIVMGGVTLRIKEEAKHVRYALTPNGIEQIMLY